MAQVETEERQHLDDVLLAMDVVDTLRHRDRIVDQALSASEREAELLKRLREIYTAQGIEVPDRILRDGVKALEEKRFAYEPPKPSFQTRLAKLYVARDRWLKPLGYGLGALVVLFGALQLTVFGPRAAEARAVEVALSEGIPARLAEIQDEVVALSDDERALSQANALVGDVERAISAGDVVGARAGIATLERFVDDLALEYDVRVVSRPGEFTGFFRQPEDRPGVRNHYLVVEALDPAGRVIEVPVRSEEDQSLRRVNLFAVRVSEAEFDRVAADKADDQIVQNAIIGAKGAGELAPTYNIDTTGAAIFEW